MDADDANTFFAEQKKKGQTEWLTAERPFEERKKKKMWLRFVFVARGSN